MATTLPATGYPRAQLPEIAAQIAAGDMLGGITLRAVKLSSGLAFAAQISTASATRDVADDNGKVKIFRDADDFLSQAGAVSMLQPQMNITFEGLEVLAPKPFTGDIVKKNRTLIANYQKRAANVATKRAALATEIQLMATDPTVPQSLRDEKQAQDNSLADLQTWLAAEIARISAVVGTSS